MADGLGDARHDFVSGTEYVIGRGGRRIPKCVDCGKAKNSGRHRPYRPLQGRTRAASGSRETPEAAPYTAPVPPSLATAPPGMVPLSALPPLEPPPEYVHAGALAVALAIDAALESDVLPPAAVAYAVALRATIGVPRFREPEAPRLVAVEEERAKVEVTPRLVAWRDPAEERRQEREDATERHRARVAEAADAVRAVPKSARARAREATKGIRNDRVRELATRAVTQGWTPRRTGDGHLRLEHAGQAPLVLSMTGTADGRSWYNARAAAKRRGVDVAGL